MNIFLAMLNSCIYFTCMGLQDKISGDLHTLIMWTNPSGIYIITYTLMIFHALLAIYLLLEKLNIKKYLEKPILHPLSIIGANSLYVFLYHSLLIDISRKCFGKHDIKITLTFGIIIALASLILPVIGKFAYDRIKKFLTEVYGNIADSNTSNNQK